MSQANARIDIDTRAKTENNSFDGIYFVAEAKLQISLPNNIVIDQDEDEWDDDFPKTFRKTRGKSDKVTVTPTRPKAKLKLVNERGETVVNKGDDATPKSDEKSGETAVNKGDDEKKSQEQGKSTFPFQLKIKPVSK